MLSWSAAGLLYSLGEAPFCPAGHEQSLRPGIELSPPTRLRVRPSSAARRMDPRGSAFGRQRLHAAVGTLGTRTLRRDGSVRPRGGVHRHPRCRIGRSSGPGTKQLGLSFIVSSRRMGVSNAGAAGGTSLRSPRAPDARAALGKRRRSSMRTPRGPDADRALRSRAKERAATAAGETQGRTQPPAGPAKQSRHAVRRKTQAAHPLGQTKPKAVAKKGTAAKPVGQGRRGEAGQSPGGGRDSGVRRRGTAVYRKTTNRGPQRAYRVPDRCPPRGNRFGRRRWRMEAFGTTAQG